MVTLLSPARAIAPSPFTRGVLPDQLPIPSWANLGLSLTGPLTLPPAPTDLTFPIPAPQPAITNLFPGKISPPGCVCLLILPGIPDKSACNTNYHTTAASLPFYYSYPKPLPPPPQNRYPAILISPLHYHHPLFCLWTLYRI